MEFFGLHRLTTPIIGELGICFACQMPITQGVWSYTIPGGDLRIEIHAEAWCARMACDAINAAQSAEEAFGQAAPGHTTHERHTR